MIDAEAPRRDLHNRVFAVLVEVLMPAAFAGVVIRSELLRRAREGLMRVIACLLYTSE